MFLDIRTPIIIPLSNPLQIVTPSTFLLNAHSLREVSLSLKTLRSGDVSVLVTAVDTDSKQLVKAWMVSGGAQEPTVTKAFQITLPTGGSKPITKVCHAS